MPWTRRTTSECWSRREASRSEAEASRTEGPTTDPPTTDYYYLYDHLYSPAALLALRAEPISVPKPEDWPKVSLVIPSLPE